MYYVLADGPLEYPCRVEQREDYWRVSSRDIPEAVTGDPDRTMAIMMAKDAIDTAIIARAKRREPIPCPTPPLSGEVIITPSVVVGLKLELHRKMHARKMKAVDIDRALHKKGAGRRLVDLAHRSTAEEVERALASVGVVATVRAFPVLDGGDVAL